MDYDLNREETRNKKMTITQEEIILMATQAAEQMMRDLFIEFWVEFLEGIKEKEIEPNMDLDFKGKKIHLTEYQALGLEHLLNQCYPERH